MTFKEMIRVIVELIEDGPPLTLNEAITACFSARIPQDSGVYRDSRKITVLADIDTYTKTLWLCAEAIAQNTAVSNKTIFLVEEMTIAEFFSVGVKNEYHTPLERKQAFINAASLYLKRYDKVATMKDDVSVINVRKLAPITYNLKELAIELLQYEEVNDAPKKT